MKTLILSDIHSNIVALEAIWNKEKDADLVLCVGDLVDIGPYPREVVQWIQAHNVPTVQGNHDQWVSYYYRTGGNIPNERNEERGWVAFNAEQLDETAVKFLEQLPLTLTFEIDGLAYGMTHLVRHYEELVSRYAFEQFRQERFKNKPYSRLILGHTHLQGVRQVSNECLWLNPGSVSYRRKGDPDKTAHYITIINGRISLNRLNYDRTKLFEAVKLIPLGALEKERTLSMW